MPLQDSAADRPTELREAAELCLEERIKRTSLAYDELTLEIAPKNIVESLAILRFEPELRMTTLVDICGVDYPGRDPRFDVVYHLLSMSRVARLRLKVQVPEGSSLASAVEVHPSANWYEREAFDMYGIEFSGHPDMRRILTDYGFRGHPLRKDFPLTGFVEVRYDEARQRVAYEPVKLTQAYRSFEFLSPWEGVAAVARSETSEQGEAE